MQSRPNERVEMAEEKIFELQNTSMQFIQTEQHRDNRQKQNRTPRKCGTITKELTFESS